MPITNFTRSVDLNNNKWYLPHPAGRGMDDGYYIIYSASSATNQINDGVGLVRGYEWGAPLSASRSDNFHQLLGTIQLVSESLSGSNNWVNYHGSNIIHIGRGVNDITEVVEDDAFFFAHLGQYGPTNATLDDFYYWDRLYLGAGSSTWTYYNYHAHNPTSYPPFNNGRFALAADNRHGPTGIEEYGHMINVSVKSGATNYLTVLARVHTPSVGGAHNSHNDLELPSVTNKNYMMGGIINGPSDRFHAFYLTANGNQWDVFSRTYNYVNRVFNAEVPHGTYDLADPQLARTPGSSSLYPFRASAGKQVAQQLYIPVIYNSGSTGTFDLKIWNFTSANNLAELPIVSTILTGSVVRPDCHLEVANNTLYAAVSNANQGGVNLYKYNAGTWEDEGQIVSNNFGKYLRVHGLNFNAEEFKFYTMISGEASGSGTNYSGSGVYAFTPDIPFLGYKHLDYITGSNSFIVRDALENGYVQFDASTGALKRSGSQEPQGLDSAMPVLQYEPNSPQFFDRRQTKFGGNEEFVYGIELQDGRQLFVGTKAEIDPTFDISYTNGIMALFSPNDTSPPEYYEVTGRFDDFITGVTQASDGKVYLVGFTKDLLVPRRNLFVHGIGRGLVKSMTTTEKIEFVDMVLDATGAQYYAGNHIQSSSVVLAKYDSNFDLQWQKDVTRNNIITTAHGIARDSSANLYVVGQIITGSAYSNAFVTKLDSTGSVVWSKVLGTPGYQITASALAPLTSPPSASFDNEYATSVTIVKNGSSDALLIPVVYTGPLSGSSTTFILMNTDGTILDEKKYGNFIVNRVRKHDTTDDGKFTFAGTQYIQDNPTYTITNSGINNYIFNGGGYTDAVDPTLTVYRNNTYTFNVTASGHPMYIKTALTTGTSDLYSGSQGTALNRSGSYVLNQGTRIYTDTGSMILFAGPDTPDTIYYACGLHSGMQGTINVLDNSTASFGVGTVTGGTLNINWIRSHTSGSSAVIGNDFRNTGTNSDYLEYVAVGSEGRNGFATELVSQSAGITREWTTTTSGSYWHAVSASPATDETSSRRFFVVGYASASGDVNQGGGDGIIAGFDNTGSVFFINGLGHTGAESLHAIERDVTTFNYITTGYSESHTNGRRGLLFRFSRNGFGTGNHHLEGTPGMAMWYVSASALTSTTSLGTFVAPSTPSNVTGTSFANTTTTFTSVTSSYMNEIYEGSTIFDALFGTLNLNDLQEYKNSGSFVEGELNPINSLISWTQIGVAGDGEADDGNIFAYDVIELTSGSNAGRIGIAAQASGDVVAYNSGDTGVYDYVLAFYDPTNPLSDTGFLLNQVGSEFDEEIYSLTELSDGRVAFVGRTAGDLGGEPVGGYDIFLGIADVRNLEQFVPPAGGAAKFTTDYYTTGSGFADRGFVVHDVHNIIPDTLAITFETSGDLGGNNQGAADIGIIFFNYSTDTWGSVYQLGTTQNESFNTLGKPSAYLLDGRIVVVGSTTGIFADDGTAFGASDIFVGIFDINTSTWRKYQIGTGAADFGNGVSSASGEKVLIAGSTAATFIAPNDAISVSFNVGTGVKGKLT